jgi:phage tail sheath protein FI
MAVVYGTPGVYIKETNPTTTPIITAGTGTTAFFGFTKKGPVQKPVAVASYKDYLKVFGGCYSTENLDLTIKAFFENGGSKAYVVRLCAFSGATKIGSASSASYGLFTFKAGYKGFESFGQEGDKLKVELALNSKYVSKVVQGSQSNLSVGTQSSDLSIKMKQVIGISSGTILKIQEGQNSVYVEVTKVQTSVVQGSVVNEVFLTKAIGVAFTTAAIVDSLHYDVVVKTLAGETLETFKQVSLSPFANDYISLVINDDIGGSEHIMIDDSAYDYTDGDSPEFSGVGTAATSITLQNGSSEKLSFDYSHFIGDADYGFGLHALDNVIDFSLIVAPQSKDNEFGLILADQIFHNAMLTYAQSRGNCFAILDAPKGLTATEILEYRENTLGVDSYWGALFYPHIKVQDPSRPGTTATITIPPCGHIAGLFAKVDGIPAPEGGVSSAAAGLSKFGALSGLVGLEKVVSDMEQETLNPAGINCIRLLDVPAGGKGIFVFGARTLSSLPQYLYIPLRRTMNFIQETIKLSTKQYLFQKNNPALWSTLSGNISAFLTTMWQQGQLAGSNVNDAFFVKIDASTNSQQDINQGILKGEIGVAFLRPAEFIVFTFTQTQSGGSIQE